MSELNLARPGPALATPQPHKQKSKPWLKSWKPGQSGNPGGRSKAKQNIVDIARSATPKAMRTMIAIMENEKAPFSVRAYCADKVIDRAYGKPAQSTNVNVSVNSRQLSQLSDAELLDIIEGSRRAPALPSPDTIEGQVEPSVEPVLDESSIESSDARDISAT